MVKYRAELADAISAMLEREQHPLATYQPGPTQQRAHQCPRRHRLIEGGNRSGKSHALGVEMAWFLTGTHPHRLAVGNEQAVLYCLSRDQAHMQWREKLLGQGACRSNPVGPGGLIPSWKIARKQNGQLDIAWDSAAGKDVPTKITVISDAGGTNTLYFKWHGDSRSWLSIQGSRFYCAFIDEAGDHTDNILAETEARFKDTMSLYGVENAGYVVWAATDTTANEEMEFWRDKAREDDPQFAWFYINEGENPAISREAEDAVAGALTEEQVGIRRGGMSEMDRRRIFPSFGETQVRRDPYEPSDRDNIIVVYDPGLVDDTGMLGVNISPDRPDVMVLTWFWAHKGMTYSEEAEALKSWLAGRKMRMLIPDPMGATRREKGTGKNSIQQLRDELMDADLWTAGRPTIMLPRGAQKDAGIRVARKRLDEGRIEVDVPDETNGLRKFITQMRMYRCKPDWDGKKFKDDCIFPRNNEGPDVLRYLCQVSPKWTDSGVNRMTLIPHEPTEMEQRLNRARDLVRRMNTRKRRSTAIHVSL